MVVTFGYIHTGKGSEAEGEDEQFEAPLGRELGQWFLGSVWQRRQNCEYLPTILVLGLIHGCCCCLQSEFFHSKKEMIKRVFSPGVPPQEDEEEMVVEEEEEGGEATGGGGEASGGEGEASPTSYHSSGSFYLEDFVTS
jgi:hypothetical protein